MNAVMEELGVVLAYRAKELNEENYNSNFGDATSGGNNLHNTAAEEGAPSGGGQNENSPAPMDIEDIVSSTNNINNTPSSSSSPSKTNTTTDNNEIPTTKRGKRIYKRKQPSNPNLGPISNSGQGAGGSGALALCLSSRRNMCVHERVLHESDREAVDSACRSMTASWVLEKAASKPGSVETCSYYDTFRDAGEATSLPSGIYDLEELKKWGKEKNWCPYYLTRQAINHATILVFNYQYMVRSVLIFCY